MTSSAVFAAPVPSDRGDGIRSIDVLLVCMAALPMGLAIDRWFGLPPALTARCGGFGSLVGTLEWHWTCMPATSLMMLCAAPAWIGLKSWSMAGRPGRAAHDCRTDALSALCSHVSMLIGMAAASAPAPALPRSPGAHGRAARLSEPWLRHDLRNGRCLALRNAQHRRETAMRTTPS